jgi:3-oxo-4-pregnene-20-carboxyl-CoA dehydrogenase alpha subunit
MDFSLTDAQREIARLAGQLLDDGKLDPWKELARAGLLALSLPVDLGGEGLGVMDAAVLLPVSFASREGPEVRTGVVIIDPAADGARVTRTGSAAGAPEYTLWLDRAPVERVLGAADCVADLSGLAVAGACCLADGALAAALELTRNHVAQRRQFGRPLAAFQAVAQQIADVYIASRTLHLATLSACWLLDTGGDAGVDLGVAGYWCAHEAPRSVRTCHHLHGGTGMDISYPLHHFSALVSDLVRYLGGADYQLERQAC